jgi:hypothetical protein
MTMMTLEENSPGQLELVIIRNDLLQEVQGVSPWYLWQNKMNSFSGYTMEGIYRCSMPRPEQLIFFHNNCYRSRHNTMHEVHSF